MTFEIENEYTGEVVEDYQEIIKTVIQAALDYEKCPYEVQVDVLLTDNDTIHGINKEYRQVDRPTDVLSFPMLNYQTPGDFSHAEDDMDAFHPETGELILGNIILSVDKIKEQATAYGHSERRELAFLVAHSMLHLMGYDHMVDDERLEMERRQREILNHCGYTRDMA